MENKRSSGHYNRERAMQEYAAAILRELPMIDRVRNKADLEKAIHEMLELLGKCSGAQRVYMFDRIREAEKEYFQLKYVWLREEQERKNVRYCRIETKEVPNWNKKLSQGKTIIIRDEEDMTAATEKEYDLLKVQNIFQRVMAPIFNRNELAGFIGMDNPYKGISELFVNQLAFVGAHLNTARENLRMFHLLEDNIQHMEKERKILNVLCEDCTSVYKVNLGNDTAEVVKLEQGANITKLISPDEKKMLCYSKEIKNYYDHFVLKESAPDLLSLFECGNLMRELKSKDKISCRFQSVANENNQQYFEIRATKLEQNVDEDGFMVLIAFRHVDEIVIEDRRHQQELETSLAEVRMNNEIISAISKIYFKIYRIDLKTLFYEEISGGSGIHRLTGCGGTASAQITQESRQQVAPEYREQVEKFYNLSTLEERMKKEESIAVDYLAMDNNWHLARFIVQSRDENGAARQVLLVIRVISEEKRREKYLIDAVEDANRANEAKSEFLSRMSHDIRTPMNAIMGFTRIARNHLEEPDKVLDCLDKIHLSGSNLQQLINDVLEISRIESGEFRIDSKPMKLSEVCESYEQSVSTMIADKNQQFCSNKHDIRYDILLADQLRLGQIYMNLLSNAVKYTPEGGKIEFEVYEEEAANPKKIRLVSVVKDNGIGMTEEFMKEMYSQFSRAVDTRVNKVQGSGLGLSIVKKIVDQMDGRIEADSTLGKGTTFRVILELPFAEEDQEVEEKGEVTSLKWNGRKETLLVVEDNDLNYEILEEQLEMYGIHCVRAVNGAECVKEYVKAPAGTYTAILMDMQMPVMNGLDAAKAIRALPQQEARQIPIIALTANAYQEDAEKCKKAGMNAHLSKPVQVEQVIKTVEKALQIR